MKQALQIAIDYMNDRLEDHDCKYQHHPATEAERINILADIETVKEALAKQEGQSNFCPQCEALARELKAAKQEQGEPVAWMHVQGGYEEPSFRQLNDHELGHGWEQYLLYTTPQKRTWVSLTTKDQKEIERQSVYVEGAIRMTEARLKEKNT